MTFRWIKGAGELYGRSPVMTALPDIKTANKVVELILKNASIAVTGIWLADDDGVLKPGQHQARAGQHHPEGRGLGGAQPCRRRAGSTSRSWCWTICAPASATP